MLFISNYFELAATCITPYTMGVVHPWYMDGPWDGRVWQTMTKIRFTINGRTYEIPAGYITDFGSVPKLLRCFVDTKDESILGYIIHDYLYGKGKKNRTETLSRAECDMVLLKITIQCGQNHLEALAAYLGVRGAGWVAYGKKANRFSQVDPDLIFQIIIDNDFNLEAYLNAK